MLVTSNAPAEVIRRFWSKVKRGGPNECWPWLAAKDWDDYGMFKSGGIQMRAHRVSWCLRHGDPGTLCVLHRCDNPRCVNPEHLFVGGNIDNIRDRDAKGRTSRGERHRFAKLTEMGVRVIRRSSLSTCKLAAVFRVHQTTVWEAKFGKGWQHVPRPAGA